MVKHLRSFFGWQYTSWFLAVFVGSGLTVLFYGHFALANALFAIAGVWSIAYWLLHDFLVRKRAALNERKVRKNPERFKEKRFNYLAWRWGISALLVLLTLAVLSFVRSVQERFELESLQGWLLPSREPDPSPRICSGPFMPKHPLTVHLGKYEVFATIFPYTVLAVNGQKAIILNRDENGRIAVSMEIRDKDGKVVVLFENGKFVINENNFLKKGTERPDRNTLVVYDQWNREVLNAHYRNPTYLDISAFLQYPGAKPVTISKDVRADVCLGDFGSTALSIITE